MGEDRMMNIQIDDSGRVVCWNLQSNSIGSDDTSIKEITVPSGVDESNFIDYIWQEDGSLLSSPLTVISTDGEPDNEKHLAYLADTDWYVTRRSDTGVAIPVDIDEARSAAREAIVQGVSE